MNLVDRYKSLSERLNIHSVKKSLGVMSSFVYLGSRPNNPVAGEAYYDLERNAMFMYAGNSWIQITMSEGK